MDEYISHYEVNNKEENIKLINQSANIPTGIKSKHKTKHRYLTPNERMDRTDPDRKIIY